MRVLCQEIGPRPATSEQEQQAADYVENTLQQLGLTISNDNNSLANPHQAGLQYPVYSLVQLQPP